MSELKEKLQLILNEKETRLKPEIIKAGETVFGVTGTYTGEEPSTEEEV